ncbi:MAG: hypothetical protein EDS66_15015 [Planctomycetota bacterium]|nr:MAG: hypothetical protein EDS66_15015 [Planctomycetota bacterium]
MDDGALLRRYDRDTRSTIHGFDFSPDGEPFGYGTNLGLTAVARNPFWCVGRYAAAESGTTVPPRFQNRTAPVMKRMFLPYRTAPVMKRMFLPYRTAPVMNEAGVPALPNRARHEAGVPALPNPHLPALYVAWRCRRSGRDASGFRRASQALNPRERLAQVASPGGLRFCSGAAIRGRGGVCRASPAFRNVM